MPMGIAPNGLALSPDGNTLYVSNSGTDDISVIDLLELKETGRERVGDRPFSLTVDGEGRIFVVETGLDQVSIYSPEFEKLASITTPKKPIDVQLSRDGKFAYVTTEKANRLFV
jgi:YVTN family beta-propeller protein